MTKPGSKKAPIYRKIQTHVWLRGSFSRLSPLAPSGQALFLYLATNPDTSRLPGLYRVGEYQLAEALGWDIEVFRTHFAELEAENMAHADWKARVLWLPSAVHVDSPSNPSVVKGWADAWDYVPDCRVKHEAWVALKTIIQGLSGDFPDAFAHACAEPAEHGGDPAPQGAPHPVRHGAPDGVLDGALHQGTENREQRTEKKKERDPPAADDVADWVEVWNANRGKLPRIDKLTQARRGAIRASLKEEPDLKLWARVIRMKALDPFWIEKKYGVTNLLRATNRTGYLEAARSMEEDPDAGLDEDTLAIIRDACHDDTVTS